MDNRLFKVLCIVMCFVMLMSLVACGQNNSNNDNPNNGNGNNTNKDPYVTDVEILSNPNKLEYYEGEIFSPSGLRFNATWMIDGKEKVIQLTYGTCEGWSYKNEPLPGDADKITFELYGFQFDIAIKVNQLMGMQIVVDSSSIRDTYVVGEKIDFSLLNVFTKTEDGAYALVQSDEYQLYNGEHLLSAEDFVGYTAQLGEQSFKVMSYDKSVSFSTTVVEEGTIVSPTRIQAENCTYMYDGVYTIDSYDVSLETTTPWGTLSNTSNYSRYNVVGSPTSLSGQTIFSGQVDSGADGYSVNSLGKNKNYYIKFTVNVPSAGEYKLSARSQLATAVGYPFNSFFKININNEMNGDALAFNSLNSLATTVKSDRVLGGNQRFYDFDTVSDYKTQGVMTATSHALDAGTGTNMYFWTTASLGTYTLQAGENVIRLASVATGNNSPNIDYFELSGADVENELDDIQLVNARGNNNFAMDSGDAVYVSCNSSLGAITNIGEIHSEHYTLMYLRFNNYSYKDINGHSVPVQDVPITEEMITGVDCTKPGVYTATVEYTSPMTFSTLTIGTTHTFTFTVIVTN